MWVQSDGQPEQWVVLIKYSPSRIQTVAEQLLHGNQDFLQCDDYAATPMFAIEPA
jgi:hypothetical protein